MPFTPALNEDVLHYVFSYLRVCDLASTALTCRRWTGPSNRWLYYTVSISDQDSESQMKIRILASTLRDCERFRRLIRTLRVVYEGHDPSVQQFYQWLLLLLPHHIHTMAITVGPKGITGGSEGDEHQGFISAVSRCPALPTIRHLAINGARASSMGGVLMTLGKLESLQIGHVLFRLRENALQLAPISRLSIAAYVYTADIFAIMRHLCGTLVHCDLRITLW